MRAFADGALVFVDASGLLASDVGVVKPVAERHPGVFEDGRRGRIFGSPRHGLDGQVLPEAVETVLWSLSFSPEEEIVMSPVLPLVFHLLYERGVGEEVLDSVLVLSDVYGSIAGERSSPLSNR